MLVAVTNDPPKAVDDEATTNSNEAVDVDVLANDSDINGDTIELVSVGSPANGNTTIVNGMVRYQPESGFLGVDSFTYTIRDAAGASANAMVRVNVIDASNTAPVAINDNHVTSFMSEITVDVLANDYDPDGDSLTVTGLTGLPSESVGTFEINEDSTVTFRPTGWPGYPPVSITYFISDGRGGTDSAILTIIDP